MPGAGRVEWTQLSRYLGQQNPAENSVAVNARRKGSHSTYGISLTLLSALFAEGGGTFFWGVIFSNIIRIMMGIEAVEVVTSMCWPIVLIA